MERAAFEELSDRKTSPEFMSAQMNGLTSFPSKITIINTKDSADALKPRVIAGTNFSYAIRVKGKEINIEKTSNFYPDKKMFLRYDTLLTRNLEQRDIYLPHKLSFIDRSCDSVVYQCTNVAYSPSEEAPKAPLLFETYFDNEKKLLFKLEIENPNRQLLKEMLWIILSSVLILAVLGFSFYYLLRTLFRQKTLEQLKSDFTRNITHELKTPIAVAAAANEALLTFSAYENPVKRLEYLHATRQQLGMLTDMVERILSIGGKEQEEFNLHLSGCNIQEILQELIKSYTIKYSGLPDKTIRFHLSVTPANLVLQLDQFHFKNILGNLIDNAVKYSNAEVDIHILVNGKQIQISDNGLGIAPQDIKRIFDKFYRVPTGNLHNVKGFGLGLYYTRLIVEKHGGTIEVTSKSGTGSTFKITL